MGSSTASAPERRGAGRPAPAGSLAAWLVLGALVAAAGPVAAGAAGTPPAAGTAGPATAGPPAEVTDLSGLLRGMRSAVGVVADFTETKELELLAEPLVATGTIYFVPPDRLVRVVTSPGRSRLVVDGSRVRMEDENGTRALDLSASPIARQMIDSFVVLFNGDEERLLELYDATFTADGEDWNLHLTPRSIPLGRMISSFDLEGRGARIDRMVAVEPDGDRATTRFGDTDVRHRFTESELAELFGEPPSS